jgi:autotransporter-associated beta strand protein
VYGNINLTSGDAAVNVFSAASGRQLTLSGVLSDLGTAAPSIVSIGTRDDTGRVIFSAINTYQGVTHINPGTTLALNGQGSMASSGGAWIQGALDIGGAQSNSFISTLSGEGSVNLGDRTLGVTAAQGAFAGSLIGSSGGLSVLGGSLVLSATQQYSGTTTIAAGARLGLMANGSISNSARVVSNGTLDLSSASSPVQITALSGSGSVTLGNNALSLTNPQGDDFSGVLSGVGGSLNLILGQQTLSGPNSYGGITHLLGGTLSLGANNALPGGSPLWIDGGSLNMAGYSTATTASVQVTSGLITGGGLLTAGSLNITGPWSLGANIIINSNIVLPTALTLMGDSSLSSSSGSITITGTVDNGVATGSSARAPRLTYVPFDLELKAANQITLSGAIGSTSRINALTVQSPLISLNADITTVNAQTFQGDVEVGDTSSAGHNFSQLTPDLVRTTGYQSFDSKYVSDKQASLVRTLISSEPNITFTGKVDDSVANTHSLVLLAISDPNTPPSQVSIRSAVGSTKPLYSLTALTLQYTEHAYAVDTAGSITVGGDITVNQNLSLSTGDMMFPGNQVTTLKSQAGTIKVQANSYTMTKGLALSYTVAQTPSIGAGPGLMRAIDDVRGLVLDTGAAVFHHNNIQANIASNIAPTETLTTQVTVGGIQSGSVSGASVAAPAAAEAVAALPSVATATVLPNSSPSTPQAANNTGLASNVTVSPAGNSATSSSASSLTTTAGSVATGAATSSRTVDVKLMPTSTRESILVDVLVPKANTTGLGALVFELPTEVRTAAQSQSITQATLLNGQPLPNWLKFDPNGLTFQAKDIPPGQLPMTVRLQVGGQQVMVTINEHPL